MLIAGARDGQDARSPLRAGPSGARMAGVIVPIPCGLRSLKLLRVRGGPLPRLLRGSI
jgi:hypothetical protein